MTINHWSGPMTERSTGRQLARFCGKPMETGRFLHLARGITSALSDLHKRHVVHKNIKPHRILVDPETDHVTILDPSAAAPLPGDHPTGRISPTLEEALAYLSPEQTGRMNRVIDYRTDLYSLGVTFYEMLTGGLPFQAADVLEWVHCHIARVPRPPHEVNPGIPVMLSRIVMKLMAKAVEDRYQTAMGVSHDLDVCRAQWEAKKEIDPFPLGEGDIPDRLLVSQKLYGREREITDLRRALERVIDTGGPELLLVAGYSGVGKTVLVRELHKPVVGRRGFFISGKFDPRTCAIPYSTITQAFRELIQQLLTESEERIVEWRRHLLSVLGANGQLIIEVIPQVELVLGKQPAVPELPPKEAQERFNRVFRQFVGVFTTKEHPLVLFLDDLQWVDLASLALLEHVVTSAETKYLLVIGAYRDNEVEPTHPLLSALRTVGSRGVSVHTITLAPLVLEDLTDLMADTFRVNRERVAPPARLVYDKTAGNPFFVTQFLITLDGEGLLEFDRTERIWKWDLARIEAKGFTDNVADLMVGKLRSLSPGTLDKLTLAACIGNRFDLHTLAIISGVPDDAVREALREAQHERLLLVVTDSSFAFLHDRVQQGAYSLIPEDRRAEVHLRIGRLLLEGTPWHAVEEKCFDIANQFYLGSELISQTKEKVRIAELNLIAGKKAKASTAYAFALRYLTLAWKLLDDTAWDLNYDLTFEVHKELAVVAYLNGNFAHSKELIDTLLHRARSDTQRAALYNILMVQYTLMGHYAEAIDTGRKALHLFGVSLPETDLHKVLAAELGKARESLGDRAVSSLVDQPEVSDPLQKVTIELLSNMLVPARYSDNLLFAVLTVIVVNLSLRFGPTPKSAISYAAYGMLLGSKMNNFADGYAFGELALRLSERFDDLSQKCQACFVLCTYLTHWVKHLKWADEMGNDGYRTGLASGELQWTGYILAYKLLHPFYRGLRIDVIQNQIPELLSFTRKTKNQWATDTLVGVHLALSELRQSSVNGAWPDEHQYLIDCEARGSSGAIARYRILRAQIHYLYGRMEEALADILASRDLLGFISSSISIAEHNFYHSLTLAALHDAASEEQKAAYRETIECNQQQMRIWMENCEENFRHQFLLVSAERARLSGNDPEAMSLYEQAIRSAHDNEFVQDEGIAYEIASRFYRLRGYGRIADTYLREARACYSRWGADGKVRHLEELHPWLATEADAASARGASAQVCQLDAITVVKASQAISGEIVLANLQATLMRTVIENAGAQKGCLLLTHGEDVVLAAEARVEGQEISVAHKTTSSLASVVPVSLINYVRRTRERVILDDASDLHTFSADPYMHEHKPVSVLCLPVLRQAALIGLLYLENNLATGAFTQDRIAVLELLAAQAAISLENATLYADVQRENADRRKAEDALRQSEAKYRATFENSGNALVVVNADMTFAMVNRQLEELTGYSKEELERNMTWPEFVTNRDDLARMKEYHRLRRIDPLSAPQSYEFQFTDREGKVKDVVVSVTVIPETSQTLAAILDISERKRTEAALRASERRLAEIIDFLPDATFAVDGEGRVIAWNRAIEEMTGRTAEYMLGRGHYEYALPFYGFRRPILIDLVLNPDARIESEYSFVVKKRGDVLWAENELFVRGDRRGFSAIAGPLYDSEGNLAGAIESIRDISERKRAEEEHVRLVTAIEQSAEAIFTTDTRGIIQYANPAFERMTAYGRNEIIGKHAGILQSDTGDQTFEVEIARALARGEVWTGRLINKRKDGTFYEAEATTSPVRDKTGSIINYVSIHRDITQLVRLERELRQAQKMEAIGTLAGGIAHDFNNILMAIIGYTELAFATAPDGSPARRYLEQVLSASSRASDLVKQILTLSRQTEQEKRPLAVESVVKEALKLIRSTLPSTIEIRQEIAVPNDGGVALADATQIHQVLLNLCTNAAHAMRTTGGILSVRLAHTRVDATLASRYRDLVPGPYVCLTVSDTGHGMDAATLDRIFDPYFTTKGPGEGTGLGLAVAQGIVRSHGGALTVYSEPGKGTTFHVYLPRITEGISPQTPVVEALPTGTERVLFIDDEQVLVDLGKDMLEPLGYRVVAKTSSLEALDLFRSQPYEFDLVITDMTMPALTGTDLARIFMELRPDIPVILCTGFSELVNGTQAKEIGIREFVMKPYIINDLAKTIRRVLEET